MKRVGKAILKIPNGPFMPQPVEVFLLQPERHEEIHDQRRTKSYERDINEIHPHFGGWNPQFSSPPVASSKGLLLEKIVDVIN